MKSTSCRVLVYAAVYGKSTRLLPWEIQQQLLGLGRCESLLHFLWNAVTTVGTNPNKFFASDGRRAQKTAQKKGTRPTPKKRLTLNHWWPLERHTTACGNRLKPKLFYQGEMCYPALENRVLFLL